MHTPSCSPHCNITQLFGDAPVRLAHAPNRLVQQRRNAIRSGLMHAVSPSLAPITCTALRSGPDPTSGAARCLYSEGWSKGASPTHMSLSGRSTRRPVYAA